MPCCSICKKEDDNPVEYGEFMHKSGISVHYYCLLLSTHLPQNGLDRSGILGFLVRDIRNEIKKCDERICSYCKQPYASIACSKCKKYFHYVCGNKNKCSFEFINDFRSYCHKHVPFKREKMLKQNKTTCWICEDALGDFSPTQTLRAYCCQNGYVHRHCMRKYALNAGYRLICIWCTSKDFRDDVRKHGVFVPDREAIWDNNETLRYTDLHRGYSQCDAKTCLCPQGRDYFSPAAWKLMVCCICGASGVHEKCGRAEITKNKYTCETCSRILMQVERVKDRPKYTNTNFNYTMFMSKNYDEAPDLLQIVNYCSSIESENSDDEVPSPSYTVVKKSKEPETQNQPTTLDGTSSNDQVLSPSYIIEKSKEPETQNQPITFVGTPSDEVPSPSYTLIKKSKEPETQNQPTPLVQSSQRKTQVTELFMFGKNSEIVGQVKVQQDKLEEKNDGFVCKEEDILEFSTSSKLLTSIFSDIEAEGRELSMDMVDEVFDRFKLSLEKFGSDSITELSLF